MPIVHNTQFYPMTWSFKYIVPKDFMVIASGLLYIKKVEEGPTGRALFHYKLKNEECAPASKIGFVMGQFNPIYKMNDLPIVSGGYAFFLNQEKH